MCSGRLYNPIFWEYYNSDGVYSDSFECSKIMNDYQVECRKEMYLYNSLPHDEEGDRQRSELLKAIFGEFEGFRKIEAPFYANYGGKHTKLKGIFFANFNLTLIEDGEIEIGDKTMVGPNVVISTAEHPKSSAIRALGQGILYNKKVTIGNNVWIGSGAQIFAGATIGDNCIIGAGSIITKNTVIPPNKIATGVVSKKIVHQLKDIKDE